MLFNKGGDPMKNNTRKFDPESYQGTYEYYVKYRPSIPEEVIDVIIEHFGIKPTDRVLDIGCGTGQVALAMDGKCAEMVCLDPDPKMLEQTKRVTKGSKTKLVWLNYTAEDLEKIREKIGIFKIATISRAFHRMNQDQVLRILDKLINEDGGIATFSDRVIWKGSEEWQLTLKTIIQKHLRKEGYTTGAKPKVSDELWEDILARSVFGVIKTHDVPTTRSWNIEGIIGYVLSTSFAAPHLFGDQLFSFKRDVRETLLSLNPEGVFQEKAIWSIVLGSRKHRN